MGGPGIICQSFALTAQLARAVDVPVIAGGGLNSWEDGINFMMWGATLVTACTVLMWEGFGAARRIVEGMERFMDESGYTSWKDVIGLSLPYLKSASELQVVPGKAVIDEDKCISCMNCVGLAHCDAIIERDGMPHVKPEECVACGICVGVCPRGAISVAER